MSLTLPSLLLKSLFGGDETAFEAACLAIYNRDFRSAPPERLSQPRYVDSRLVTVRTAYHEHRADREYTYWHLITGDEGNPGTPVLQPEEERIERMPYVRPFIEQSADAAFKVWLNVRGKNNHLCIWHDGLNVLVVLADYGNVWELKTLYRPKRSRKEQLHREYARNKQTWQ